MSQAKLEFLAGKSVPAIIDWMLENMNETDIRGCLDAAGIQTSVGSRSVPSSSEAGSSTDPLPPFSSAAAAGSSTDPSFLRAAAAGSRPFSRAAAAAGSSTDPLPPFSRAAAAGSRPFSSAAAAGSRPFSSAAAAGSSTDPLPFFTPGAATRLISRQPSEGPIRASLYEPPEETINPYSTFIAPGLKERLLGNEFGQRNKTLLQRFVTIQKEVQEQNTGNNINFIPILVFNLEEKNGRQSLSFIISEPIYENDLREDKISGYNQGELELKFRTMIITLLNKWNSFLDKFTPEDIQDIINKMDISWNNFFDELNKPIIDKIIEELYLKKNNFGQKIPLEDIDIGKFMKGEKPEFKEKELDFINEEEPEFMKGEDNGGLDFINKGEELEFEKELDFMNKGEELEFEKELDFMNEEDYNGREFLDLDEEDNGGEFLDLDEKDNGGELYFAKSRNKPKKFGKVSNMNKEELREYVINKFGQSYYNEYEPQVYTTKTGFGNVRYVKRSSPLTESKMLDPNYDDYSMEQPPGNSAVSLFD